MIDINELRIVLARHGTSVLNEDEILELLDRLEAAESDALEQARLNGMGASREASLMAKLEAAEKERDKYKRAYIEWCEKTEWVQDGINNESISPKYLGWHRADITSDLLKKAETERDDLRAALEKIADWHGAWGPYPETNKSWCAMAIVTAREAVKPLTNLCAKGE